MITVVIATYNRGGRLAVTLDSLAGQTLPPNEWEVVVVNNNSTDDTAEVAQRFTAAHPEMTIRTILELNQGVSWARNRGLAEARGEWVVLIDDDVQLPADFLEQYARFFATHPEAVAVGGRVVPKPEADVPRWMSRYPMMAIGGALDLGEQSKFFTRGRTVIGANNALRRALIETVGNYNTTLGRTGNNPLGGEEKDLSKRILQAGYPIHYLHAAWLWHLVPASRMTRTYFARLCRLIGQSERRRTLNISRRAYFARLAAEAIKWGGATLFALGYLLQCRPSRGGYLLLMRWQITCGLIMNYEL